MGDYPERGSTDPGAVDSYPNPQRRTHPGGASTDSPPQPASQGPPANPQSPATPNGTWWQTAIFAGWIPTAAAIATIAAFTITVFPLLKPDTPMVPVVRLAHEADAIQILRKARYEPDVIPAADDTIPKGMASKTDPAEGTPFSPGQHVKLFISTGNCQEPCLVEVPSVERLPVNEAQSKLEDKKFTVRINRVFNNEWPVDQVIASDPKAMTLRPLGSAVSLTVSSGSQGSSSAPQPTLPQPAPLQPALSRPVPLQPVPLQPVPPRPTPPQPTPQPPPSRTCPPSSDDQPPTGLTITSPGREDLLTQKNDSSGTARLASGEHLWLLLCAPGAHLFYFVSETGHETLVSSNSTWHDRIYLNPDEHGEFFLYAVVVNTEDNRVLDQSSTAGVPVPELPQSARYFRVAVRCCS